MGHPAAAAQLHEVLRCLLCIGGNEGMGLATPHGSSLLVAGLPLSRAASTFALGCCPRLSSTNSLPTLCAGLVILSAGLIILSVGLVILSAGWIIVSAGLVILSVGLVILTL